MIFYIHINTVRMVENKPAAQAAGQALPDATPPVGKISKTVITFEPIPLLGCPSIFRIFDKMSI